MLLSQDPPTKKKIPILAQDARYQWYVASTTRNAVGPSVSDPRSGEIIESDIICTTIIRSYRNRYLLETER
jgi:hypothetical protein